MAGHTLGADVQPEYKDQEEPTEHLQDHDKDFKPIALYNPMTGKHDIKFAATNRSIARQHW